MELNETVLVTGTSKGIGRSIAIEVAKKYKVVAHYNKDLQGAQKTMRLINDNGGYCRLVSFDISNRTECLNKITADINEFGAYYGVVLNAGISKDNAFPALEDDDWDNVVRTNLDGFYNVLKPIVMPMVHRKKPGRIVTLSSLSGVVGNRGQVNYSATKAGIIGATKALAVELAKRNITVNAIAPGLIDTQMISDLPIDEIKQIIPMQRVGKPEEVAATVMFLLSEGAGYITRQVINVNGGIA